MDAPGFSLFQGAESIHVEGLSNAAAAEEEAEDLLDRKRRENELGEQLQNAFDDLEEDDETMDNSYRSGNSYHPEVVHRNAYKRNYLQDDDDGDCHGNDQEEENRNAIYRLRVELQSKTNELAHVNQLLTEERQTSQRTIGDLKKQLALAVAEGERAQLQKNQTHELLVESKAQISELDATLAKLKEQNKNLEIEKGQLIVDLDNARTLLNDSEMKCHMMQKEMTRPGAMNSSRGQQDAAFKQLTERNAAQTEMLQQQIDNFRNKLEARDVELRTMEAKYRELQKTRETLMIEKTETINQLTEQLERAQRQCQDLLINQTVSRGSELENGRLKKKVNDLEQHIEDLQKTTDGLLKQLDSRRDFANVLESTPHTRKIPHLGLQGMEETDKLVKEVEDLKREVQEKATEIKNLIMTENDLRQKLRSLEQEKKEILGKKHQNLNISGGCGDCRMTKAQLNELKTLNEHLTESNCDLQKVNKRIIETQEKDNRLVVEKLHELKTLQEVIKEQKQRIESLEKEKETMDKNFAKERQKIREMSEHSLQCMEKMRVATEIEVKNMQLQTDCMDYLKNLKGLRAASQIISEAQTQPNSAYTESTSAQGTTQKTYCDRSVMVSTPSDFCSVGSQTSTTGDTPNSASSGSTVTEEKSSIIQEYAKLSAAEIKRVEEKYRNQLFSVQQELALANHDLADMRRVFAEETEVFKEVLLAEREEYEKLLETREKEIEVLKTRLMALEQKTTRTEREDELLQSLEQELKKKQEEIDEERKSMTLWRKQWKEERKQLIAIEEHLKKENEVLRENWKSAKSTATNYKKYTEEKDKFINREIERMRMQYEGVIEKLRLKCKRMGA